MWQLSSFIINSALASLLLLLISANSVAENIQTQSKVANIQALLPTSCVFSSSFQQEKQSQKLPFPLRSAGQIFFDCNKGLLWENKSPFLEETIFTTKGENFRLVPDEPIEKLEGPQYDYLSSLLLSILSADVAEIKNRFDIDISKNNHIELTPKSSTIKKRLHSIDIQKDGGVENESLDITISTQKNQTTKISINNISNLDNIKPGDNTDYHPCLPRLESENNIKESCEILRNPQKYISLDINNQK